MNETILVVDDEQDIRTALAGILEDEGYRTAFARDGVEALETVQKDRPDLVLLDIWMPRLDGMETLQRLKAADPGLTVVMMSGHGTIETAVKSTKMGAFDFIEKPLSLEKILVTVRNGLDAGRLRAENDSLRALSFRGHEIMGESEAMGRLREQVRLAGPADAPVLITGENGAGKELAARSLHYHSSRRDRPFVELDCAALPEELIESELFGHEKGFAGAATQKKGKLDLANGGTMFLDEIGDMPPRAQAKLLRLIQERKFERAGGTRSIEADVRIMAASTKNLEEEVRAGRFSPDLFYRLNVVSLAVPPLRERQEDIVPLVEHFLDIFARRESQERKTMPPEALAILARHDWPGNVRELRTIVERLVIMTPGRVITPDRIPPSIGEGAGREGVLPRSEAALEPSSLREAREEFEREFIIQKLEEYGWNISRTADAIELERSNLYRKMKSYGIDAKK
ncbi:MULTISPECIES: sigma-54-dependent transcriptional regulator [Geobacter]|uniref:sigma-54-dependent transcriptional regulator n=1 Tax=Geobacter TaxID=28231 RepID=UPI002574225F|nr:sigma-54 dependent transcriptional regulator [Geobacter sulfurreducens]BEH11187.1 sigma-54 dependent transcriptional regulator [Geobacter sulfurreducens subsp. ethanolicus]BET59036.1 sigma-54 dependent transcriptional regulator [Geobacter sp. 60473]